MKNYPVAITIRVLKAVTSVLVKQKDRGGGCKFKNCFTNKNLNKNKSPFPWTEKIK